MNFCTLFLKTENVHLMKDIGQLAFCLKRDYGYNAYIATYKNGDYPYLMNEVKGLELQFVRKSIAGQVFDGMRYLFKMRKDIDVLNVYHLNLSSFVWILFIKIVCKKRVIAYLKLDANHLEIRKMQHKNLKSWIKKITLNMADIVSVESTAIQKALQKYCNTSIIYIPNGYLDSKETEKIHKKKENIILTVGRLGTYAKATEVLVEAFLQSNVATTWKLVLVGSMTSEFRVWLENKLLQYPDAGKCVIVTGNIENKECLEEWYCKSKIFVLPSRYEGFPLVLIEALMHGCYVITTNVVLAAKDLIRNDRTGSFVMVDSQEELIDALRRASCLEIDWDKNARQIEKDVKDKFLWKNILKRLDDRIKKYVEESECVILR